MVEIPPIKMVMTGGCAIIVPTFIGKNMALTHRPQHMKRMNSATSKAPLPLKSTLECNRRASLNSEKGKLRWSSTWDMCLKVVDGNILG
jgi:hypothetical protein